MQPTALTIAGSDSGGGAGVQVDLRMFARLGVFGTSAITAITAQNLAGVHAVSGLAPALVLAQINAVLSGFEVGGVKTGMLWSASIVHAVATRLAQAKLPVVVDPVMVATSGAMLLEPTAIAAYRSALLPRATLVTPNLDEAGVLLERALEPTVDPAPVADALYQSLGVPVLLKGGHLAGDPVDILRTATQRIVHRHPRIEGANTHGSGCMLSAAIAARLAQNAPLAAAVADALAIVHDALARGAQTPGNHLARVELAEINPTHIHRTHQELS